LPRSLTNINKLSLTEPPQAYREADIPLHYRGPCGGQREYRFALLRPLPACTALEPCARRTAQLYHCAQSPGKSNRLHRDRAWNKIKNFWKGGSPHMDQWILQTRAVVFRYMFRLETLFFKVSVSKVWSLGTCPSCLVKWPFSDTWVGRIFYFSCRTITASKYAESNPVARLPVPCNVQWV